MPLTLHFHPLASFCWKVLIAFYENGAPFESAAVNLMDPEAAAAFRKISPMGKMPALVDDVRGRSLWESTIQIEYLDSFYPGAVRLLPQDGDAALEVRLWDRFYDLYVHEPMQGIVANQLRPEAKRDAEQADALRAQLQKAYAVADAEIRRRRWAAGEAFTLADCAAAPALFYAHIVSPIPQESPALRAYLDRLMARPSFARVLQEARPFFQYYPFESDLKTAYPALASQA